MEVAERTVVVTGAGSGIGSRCAVALAHRGAHVVLVDRDADGLDTVADEIGGGLIATIDVTNVHGLTALFADLAAEGQDLAAVVNAAGIVTGGQSWPASDLDRMQSVLRINAGGTITTTTLAANFPTSHERAVVNLASAAAIRPLPPDPAYAMSKAGVVAFTRSAALNDAALRVNAVLPGVVDTPMLVTTGAGRVADWLEHRMSGPLLTAHDVAEAIVELIVGDYNGVAWSLELGADGEVHTIEV
jgi:NAD(P)-dependent dehydrogenase (short-subunit alcohol dehydrogenase family)